MKELINDIWVLEIPRDAYGFEFYRSQGSKRFGYWFKPDGISEYDSIKLPPGQWSLICLSDSITEEQAAGIVELIEDSDNEKVFVNYLGDYGNKNSKWFGCFPCESSIDSFQSLLRSKGLLGRYAILKKVL